MTSFGISDGPLPPNGKFYKSRRCGQTSACVMVAWDGETIMVGDSKTSSAPTLSFNIDEWDAFIQGVKQGEFDLSSK